MQLRPSGRVHTGFEVFAKCELPLSQVSEEDFCEGGALAHLQMELQLWAAYRGQLLSRTVRGALARWTLVV